jgi:hypothetical protein
MCFITSDEWTRSIYGNKVRNTLGTKNLTIKNECTKFKNINIQTIIFLYKREANKKDSSLIINKMKQNFTTLGNICNIYLGIQIIDRNINLLNHNKNSKDCYPMIHGKDIKPYITEQPSSWFIYDKQNCKSGWDLNVYNKDTIVIPQCREYLCASIREKGILSSNTVFNVFLKNNVNYNLYVILAILNSNFMKNWFSVNLSDNKNNFPKLNKYQLEMIPMPSQIHSDIENEITLLLKDTHVKNINQKRIDTIIDSLYKGFNNDND